MKWFPSGRRQLLGLLGLLIAVSLVTTGVVGPFGGDSGGEAVPREAVSTVQPVDNGSELWAWTSRSESFSGRTLPINLLVKGDPDRVRSRFQQGRFGNWSEDPAPNATIGREANASAPGPGENASPTDGPNATANATTNETAEDGLVNASALDWIPAEGADRYTYVESPDGEGVWIPVSYQLYDGSYLGSRNHIRAYESPHGDNWTAMQAHAEYWDWFRLRHSVTSDAEAQRYVEQRFLDAGEEDLVVKRYLDNARQDHNGWATVIELSALLVLLGSVGSLSGRLRRLREALARELSAERRREALDVGALFGAIVGLYLFVRMGGVYFETRYPQVHPKLIAGMLYPLLVGGLPLSAYLLGRRCDVDDAFVAASVALPVAFLLEFSYLKLPTIPIDVLTHRVALVLSLGLIAAGGAVAADERDLDNDLARLGALGWIVALALPLLSFL